MKNKTLTKILSAFLAVVMVLGSAPLSGFVGLKFPDIKLPDWLDFNIEASAESYSGSCGATDEDNVNWSLDTETGVLNITGAGAMMNYSHESSAPWLFYQDSIITVNIGNGITSIGDNALYYCPNLTSIEIPDSVTSIGDWAFYSCNSLTAVTIPESVTSMGDGVFEYCENLESVTIPEKVTSIGSNAFTSCHSLESVTIPDSVTSIGDDAFAFCEKLTSITIPDSVMSIGDSVFSNCASLTSITVDSNNKNYCSDSSGVLYNKDKTILIQYPIGNSRTSFSIPDTVINVNDSAFKFCTNLTSIIIPDSVKTIGDYAFCGCTNLISITSSNSIEVMGYYAFYNTGYYNDSSNWENDVLYISNHLIKAKDTLSGTYTIKPGTKTISGGAFEDCTELISVIIPESVTSIDRCAFWYCTSLTTIKIPDSVTSIGDDAFRGCTNLESVEIPDSVTSIGDDAFCGCTSFESVEIPDSVTNIGRCAFYGCDTLELIEIPQNVESIGEEAFAYCTNLESITVDLNNENYSSDSSGVLYNKDKTVLMQYPAGNSRTSFLIPDSVKSIDKSAFVCCENLTSITIPSSVTSIGYAAFYSCTSLESVAIPDSVTSLDYYVFYCCTSLTSVRFTDSVAVIPEGTFNNCTSLETVEIPDGVTCIGPEAFRYCNSLISVTIPDSVTCIEWNAFRSCESLIAVEIPESVMEIESDAFSYCDSLWHVYYSGTKNQWDNMYKYDDMLSEETTIHFNATLDDAFSVTRKVDSTCAQQGFVEYYCSLCDEEYLSFTEETVPHVFEDGVCTSCGISEEDLLESDHPYENYCDETWTIYRPGAESISITFSEDTFVEWDYDYIYIGFTSLDQSNGNEFYEAFEDIVENADNVVVEEAIQYVVTTISELTGADAETVKLVVINAVDEYGIEDIEVVSSETVAGLIDNICIKLEANGVDSTPIIDELAESDVGGGIVGFQQYTGSELASQTITVPGDTVEIRLTSDGSANGYGFKVTNIQVNYPEECTHSETVVSGAIDATCTEAGYTGDIYCVICDELLESGTEKEPLGHSWGEWETTLEPTLTTDGTETRGCLVCSATEEKILPKTGVQLTVTDTEGKVIAETVVEADITEYTFTDLADGEYTLAVQKGEYVTREYVLTSVEGEAYSEIKLHRIGDINGDGKVTVLDYNQVLKHVKKTGNLDDYERACADVDGNGKVMVSDYARILRHVKKIDLLW